MTAEVIDHATGEVVDTITASDARRLTTEAQNEFCSASDHFGKAWSLIEQAVTGGGHLALGYRSPGDYLHSEFDDVLEGLDVAQRRVGVRSMVALGLSTRAIAAVVGESQQVVHNDIKVTKSLSPELPRVSVGGGDARQREEARHAASQPLATDAPEPRPPVIGIDGKTYTRPEPSAPRRTPLGDGFRDASIDLHKLVRRVEKLFTDDRFPRNKEEVAARYRGDLILARDALDRLIGQLS